MTHEFLLDLGNKYPTKWILVDETLTVYKVFNSKVDALAEKDKNRWQYLVHGNNIIEFSHLEMLPNLEEVFEISKLQKLRFVLFSEIKRDYQFFGNSTILDDRKNVFVLFKQGHWTHLILDGQILGKK